MHIAIAVWGLMRSLPYTIESFREFCLTPIVSQGHTYELFLHTYNFTGAYENERNGEDAVQLDFSDWKTLNADVAIVQDQDTFDMTFPYKDYMSMGDPWKNNFTSFRNHIRALNSLYQVTIAVEIAAEGTRFDAVAFLRPDVKFLNELPIYLLEAYDGTLFVPGFHRSCRGSQLNDRMALGDLTSGLVFGKRLESALEYSKRKQLHSEQFAHDHLMSNNISVMEVPVVFQRVRSTGVVHLRDRSLVTPDQLQQGSPQHTTPWPERLFYSLLEAISMQQVYIWNHDDHNNQRCSPHPCVPHERCLALRAEALRLVADRPRSVHNTKLLEELNSYDIQGNALVLAAPGGSRQLRREPAKIEPKTSRNYANDRHDTKVTFLR